MGRTTSKTPPRYPCAMCGKQHEAEEMTYSRFTGNRYCPPRDHRTCQRTRRRLIKTGVIDLAEQNAEVRAAMRRAG